MQQITMHPEDDSLHVQFSEAPTAGGRLLDRDGARTLYLSEDGAPVGVTFLYVSDGVDLKGVPVPDPAALREALTAAHVKVA